MSHAGRNGTISRAAIGLVCAFAAAISLTSGAAPARAATDPYATRILARSSLAAYWRLGEATGTIARDAGGTRDGTYDGAVTLGAPGALSGDPDTSASFAGGRVDTPAMPLAGDFTIEGWMRLKEGAGRNNTLFGGINTVKLIARPTGYLTGVTLNGTEHRLVGKTAGNVGSWVHWALVRQGTSLTLYRNAVPIAVRTSLPGGAAVRLDGDIGRFGSSYPAAGEIDDLSIYSSALSAADISADYLSRTVPTEEPPAGEEPPPAGGGGGTDPVVSGTGFERRTIYHSPQTPGYTAWVGSWIAPDGDLMTAFPQMTGPVLSTPDRDWWRLDGTSMMLRSGDRGASWQQVRSDSFEGPPHSYSGQATIGLRDGSILRRVNGEDLRQPGTSPAPSGAYATRVLGRSSLLSYWRLGEPSGATTADAKSTRDGVLEGSVSLGAPGALSGDPDTSARFTGGRVDVPAMPTSTDFTVEGWQRLASDASSNNTLYGESGALRLMPRPGGFYAGVWIGGIEYKLQGVTASNLGSWVHWAFTRRGSTLTVYRNGVQVAQTLTLPGTATARLDGGIGSQGASYPTRGEVDEVAVYSSALSATEIQGDYLSQAADPTATEEPAAGTTSDGPYTAYLQRLAPGGNDWGPPQVLLDPARFTYNLSRIQYLSDGRLIATGNYWEIPAGERTAKSVEIPLDKQGWLLMVSDDEGRTWRNGLTVPPENRVMPNEWDVAELPSGDLLAVMRTRDPNNLTVQVRRQALLRKEGDGWVMGAPRATPFPHSGHPELLATTQGVVLHIATSGTHYTPDGGATWVPLEVSGPGEFRSNYYPISMQAADGSVYVLGHVGGDDDYGERDQSITMARFGLAVH